MNNRLQSIYDKSQSKRCCINCHREILISELQDDLGILGLINDIDNPETEGSQITCTVDWECVNCKTFNKISVTIKGHDEMWYEDANSVSFEGFGYTEVEDFEVVCSSTSLLIVK